MTRRLTIAMLALAVLYFGFAWSAAPATAAAPTRIGVFDSRAIAIAYWRSDEGMRQLRGMKDEYEKAKTAGDEKRVKELEQEGPWQQVRMHQQAFSTATVSSIMARISDRLPAVASAAGVSAIVSKWEVPYKDGSVETVDVTRQIVRLLNQDAQMLKMIDEIQAQPPVPFEKLPLDPRM